MNIEDYNVDEIINELRRRVAPLGELEYEFYAEAPSAGIVEELLGELYWAWVELDAAVTNAKIVRAERDCDV